MKVISTAGLVGFLLALSSVNIPKTQATNNNSEKSIESRLGRIAKVIREKENQVEASLDTTDIDSSYIAGTFINSGNSGIGFLNRSPNFRNNFSGWRNGGVSGWRNGGGGSAWRNGGSFRNF